MPDVIVIVFWRQSNGTYFKLMKREEIKEKAQGH